MVYWQYRLVLPVINCNFSVGLGCLAVDITDEKDHRLLAWIDFAGKSYAHINDNNKIWRK